MYPKFRNNMPMQMPTIGNYPMPSMPMGNMPNIPKMPNMPMIQQEKPAQNIPSENMPAKNMPLQNIPVQNVPAQSIPSQNITGTTSQITGLPALPTGIPTGPSPTPITGVIPGTPVLDEQPPETLQSPLYTPGYLKTQIGRKMRVEFLLGSGMYTDRTGTLVAVGVSYIILKIVGTDDLMVCDIYSIKFVTIFH